MLGTVGLVVPRFWRRSPNLSKLLKLERGFWEAYKSAQLLLQHRADVNGMAQPRGLTFLVGSLAQLHSKLWGATRRAPRAPYSFLKAPFGDVFGGSLPIFA